MQLNMESKMDKKILNKGLSISAFNSKKEISYRRKYINKILYCLFALSFILFIIVATIWSDYCNDNIHGFLYFLPFIPITFPLFSFVFGY